MVRGLVMIGWGTRRGVGEVSDVADSCEKPISVRASFDRSVRAAVRAGLIKKIDQAAVIDAARKVADYMDTPGWPYVDEKLDTVTAGTFLKYCDSLGITPKLDAKPNKDGSKLARIKELDGGLNGKAGSSEARRK